MNRIATLSLFLALAAMESQAQLNRSAVAVSGNDANPCSVAQPCRTFAAAMAQTNAGGEIVALESGGYGAIVINKPVTVQAAPGVIAGITATSGDAVLITAAVNAPVVIRGLRLKGLGASNGINHESFNMDHTSIENCVIDGFNDNGIRIGSFSTAHFYVKDTTVRNNGASGIVLASVNGPRMTLDHVRLLGNSGEGFLATGYSKVTIRDSVMAGNGFGVRLETSGHAQVHIEDSISVNNTSGGFVARATGAGSAQMYLERVRSSRNQTGIFAGIFGSNQPAEIYVSNSSITNNTIGVEWIGTGAFVRSRVNNTVEGNGSNETFTSTFAAE